MKNNMKMPLSMLLNPKSKNQDSLAFKGVTLSMISGEYDEDGLKKYAKTYRTPARTIIDNKWVYVNDKGDILDVEDDVNVDLSEERSIFRGSIRVGSVVRAIYVNASGINDYMVEVIGFTPKKVRVRRVNGYVELRALRDLRISDKRVV